MVDTVNEMIRKIQGKPSNVPVTKQLSGNENDDAKNADHDDGYDP
jgi:hypothetical protein